MGTESSAIDSCFGQIEERRLQSGGFSEHTGGIYRPDSTAWAVLALSRRNGQSSSVESDRSTLAASQLKDGRVPLPGSADVFWPTPLAVLAWSNASQFDKAKNRAISFLLETSGRHPRFNANSPVGHDTSIKGWPWVAETHSFVDPTAMTLLALDITGHSTHPRFREAVSMILNRQLPRGGWNYGNTLVYGKELYPFVDTTGLALAALAGHVAKDSVGNSLRYLNTEAENSRTPLSLAWAIFGLGAWGELPAAAPGWIEESLMKQTKYGPYGTSLLSILALAHLCRGDFRRCVI